MPPMNLTDSVALVTGANRGLGARLVTELLRAGAARVYATSRTPGPGDRDDPGCGD
jgi:NAD(P)-dependent dehydrogenase (short-subunit alcohol dehydrogenase family)